MRTPTVPDSPFERTRPNLPRTCACRPCRSSGSPACAHVFHRSRYRIGLIANRAHQDASDSALVQLLTGSRHRIESLQPELIVVGRTLDAIGQ
jgi:hypothetical protein